MSQEKTIKIVILGDESHRRLVKLLEETYKVLLITDSISLRANIKEADLILVDELKDNWDVAGIIKASKKESLEIAPISQLSNTDKKALLELIHLKAQELRNRVKVELTFPQEKLTLTEEEINVLLKVNELLRPIKITVLFPNGYKQEIERK